MYSTCIILSSKLTSLISLSVSADISPPAKGVDHRHVQKELGEVIVRLHNPVVLSPTTIQVTWTVSQIFQYFQYSVIRWWAVEMTPKYAPGCLASSLILKSLHNWCTVETLCLWIVPLWLIADADSNTFGGTEYVHDCPASHTRSTWKNTGSHLVLHQSKIFSIFFSMKING